MRVRDKALARCFIGYASRSIRMVPVHQRVVEADAQSFCPRGVDEFAYQIASRRLLWRAVVGELRVEITEAFMMVRSHHHVLLSGLLGQSCPVARGVRLRIEMLRQHFVLRDGYALHFHRPLMTAYQAIESPVNEHAEFCFLPPLNSTLMPRRRSRLLRGLFCRILLRESKRRCRRQSCGCRHHLQTIPSRCSSVHDRCLSGMHCDLCNPNCTKRDSTPASQASRDFGVSCSDWATKMASLHPLPPTREIRICTCVVQYETYARRAECGRGTRPAQRERCPAPS